MKIAGLGLTLLQSMEAGRSGDFKESALGYYYQYLLTEAFQEAGVEPDKLTEVFHYATQLAAEYHRLGKSELSEGELRDFNTEFSGRWHSVEFGSRLAMLLRARVLCQVGTDYGFRYPYIYYYLKGQFLADNIRDPEIREYVEHCCLHLYVRDYAHTVLFLAHHTTDAFVLEAMMRSLDSLFKEWTPITFSGDTNGIRQLIEDAPKLVYSGETPEEHRRKANALRDNVVNETDDADEAEEESGELSIVAQVTMLFRTIEILGQVLKNQYAKIERPRKGAILEGLFNGPLRALKSFYEFCERNPEGMVLAIEAVMRRKGELNEKERRLLARRVVAGLVQVLTFSFLWRAARAANAEALREDVRGVVDGGASVAFRLIDLCIDLDSPRPIPRQKLLGLEREGQRDVMLGRVMLLAVINRLYMFKTSEKDMQWLSAKMGLAIKGQHTITYEQRRQRLIE